MKITLSLIISALCSLCTAAAAPSQMAVVDTLSELQSYDGTSVRAVEVLGYYDAHDGAGGIFVWDPEFAGEVDGNLRIRPANRTQGAWIRQIRDGVLNVRWFGARGDGQADDTAPIKAAFAEAGRQIGTARVGRDTLRLFSNPVVFFPAGQYIVYDQLTITEGPLTIRGQGESSQLRYMGEAFVDLLHFDLTGERITRNIHITDIALRGGDFNGGRARYVVNAKRFTRQCHIERVSIQSGVGLLRLDGCWYANVVDTVIAGVNPNPSWLSKEQLAEVHGPDSAPVYLTGGGSFQFNRIALFRLALNRDMPIQTFRSIYIRSQATDFSTNSIEGVANPGTEYEKNNYPDYLLWVSGNVNVSQLYMEANQAAKALVMVQGGSTLSAINQSMFYHVVAPVLFANEGIGDLVVRDGFFYRVRAAKLWEVNEPRFGSMGSTVIFDNSIVLGGERKGNRNTGFSYDMADNAHSHTGIADGSGGRAEKREAFPRIIHGYAADFGIDSRGPYVMMDGGVFQRENGSIVSNKHLNLVDGVETDNPGSDLDSANLTEMRKQYLRFSEQASDRRDRWYRLMVGRGGQPWLESFQDKPATKTGNWILQFKLNHRDQPEEVLHNPLLSLEGRYISTHSELSVHYADRPPEKGFWIKGDRVVAIDPLANRQAAAEWVCVESGLPGRWITVSRVER